MHTMNLVVFGIIFPVSWNERIVSDIFSTQMICLINVFPGRKRSFLVYADFSKQWREQYLELNEAEKREWLKNKMAERQIIREVGIP